MSVIADVIESDNCQFSTTEEKLRKNVECAFENLVLVFQTLRQISFY